MGRGEEKAGQAAGLLGMSTQPGQRYPCMQCNHPQLLLSPPSSRPHVPCTWFGFENSSFGRIVPALCAPRKYFSLSCKGLSPPAQSTGSCSIKTCSFFNPAKQTENPVAISSYFVSFFIKGAPSLSFHWEFSCRNRTFMC